MGVAVITRTLLYSGTTAEQVDSCNHMTKANSLFKSHFDVETTIQDNIWTLTLTDSFRETLTT